ncbi:capping complex subunit for YIEGIA [Rossellomorea marisflavi]|uniref:capping complex subunit for YIEGIA n=1 Tax=Rossellomorea marisflavi TaxID=189381 RepID=UPI00345A132D
MSTVIQKFILAAVTTSPERVPSGTAVFHCKTIEELEKVCNNLEAILDGIAHELDEGLFIIVKH